MVESRFVTPEEAAAIAHQEDQRKQAEASVGDARLSQPPQQDTLVRKPQKPQPLQQVEQLSSPQEAPVQHVVEPPPAKKDNTGLIAGIVGFVAAAGAITYAVVTHKNGKQALEQAAKQTADQLAEQGKQHADDLAILKDEAAELARLKELAESKPFKLGKFLNAAKNGKFEEIVQNPKMSVDKRLQAWDNILQRDTNVDGQKLRSTELVHKALEAISTDTKDMNKSQRENHYEFVEKMMDGMRSSNFLDNFDKSDFVMRLSALPKALSEKTGGLPRDFRLTSHQLASLEMKRGIFLLVESKDENLQLLALKHIDAMHPKTISLQEKEIDRLRTLIAVPEKAKDDNDLKQNVRHFAQQVFAKATDPRLVHDLDAATNDLITAKGGGDKEAVMKALGDLFTKRITNGNDRGLGLIMVNTTNADQGDEVVQFFRKNAKINSSWKNPKSLMSNTRPLEMSDIIQKINSGRRSEAEHEIMGRLTGRNPMLVINMDDLDNITDETTRNQFKETLANELHNIAVGSSSGGFASTIRPTILIVGDTSKVPTLSFKKSSKEFEKNVIRI